MGEARHSFAGLPQVSLHGGSIVDHDYNAGSPSGAQWDTGYGGDYSGYHEGGSYYPSQGYPEPSLQAGTSASARYPD
jgi:hypothetical protein